MSLKSKGSVHILSLWGVLRCQGVYDLSGASPLGHFRLSVVKVHSAEPAWDSSGTWYFIVRNIFVKVFFILWPYFLLDCESVFFVIKHFKKGKSVNYHAFVNKFR